MTIFAYLMSPISILILNHKFAVSNIGEYPVSPVIGPLSALCFPPRIANTGWPIIGTLMVCPQNHSHSAFLWAACINIRQMMPLERILLISCLWRCLYKSVTTSGGSFCRHEAASIWLSGVLTLSPSENRARCLMTKVFEEQPRLHWVC